MSWWRRCAIFTALVFGLSVAVPSQVVQGGGDFPIAWLGDLFRLPAAWASITGLPAQEHRDPGHGGYVPASATGSGRGAGRPQRKVAGGLDGYQPHDPAAASASAAKKTDKARTGFAAKTSKRDAAKSKANMNQFANADGSTTREYTAGSGNFKAKDGSWQPIDSTLVRSGSSWTMKANSIDVSLSPSAAEPLASVGLPEGVSVGYDLAGAAPVAPTVSGSTATYGDILPGTDLELRTITSGIKETLVLDSPAAANEWTFPLHLDGLIPRMTDTGSVELVDASATVKARFPHGSMTDANFDNRSGDFVRSSAVEMSLVEVDGAPALKVVADRAWLDDPARVYPVRVDPTLTTVDTGSAFADNDSSTVEADQGGDNLAIGTYNGGTTKARSFINFGYFDDQINGSKVTAASLRLFLTWEAGCPNYRPFSVYPVSGSWSATNVAKAAYPGPAISATAIGTLTVTAPGTACTNTAGNRRVGTWVTVPLSVGALNDWTANKAPYGLALTADVTDSNAWKRFTSERVDAGAYAPRLQLTYTPDVLPQVDTRYPADNATVETLTPQLVTRAHDPDAWPNKGLSYVYNVYNSAGALVTTSNTITTPTWQVPAGKLAWNSTYQYTVTVGDKLFNAAATEEYIFSTPVPQPRLTSDLAQNPGAGFDPKNGNYTTSASDAQVAGVGPALEISRSYNSLDVRRTGAFGQGWSSILDVKATEQKDAAGALQTVVITYPNGSEVAFGRNADGTFTAPTGRYAVLTKQTVGYTLTDKDATQYVFGRGNGVYQITKIVDANGRALTFAYNESTGLLSTMTGASGRNLTLTWAVSASPTAGAAHVTSVTTDAPTAGGTGYTWTYGYGTHDRLTSVCPPGTTTACTVYTWDNWNNQYANAALNLNPYSFWRLNETSGTSAVSSVLTNAGVDNGTYHDVNLGGPPALADSGSPSAGFGGSSSYVQLPGKLVNDGSYQTVSMWFKTTTPGGVLFSYSGDAITKGSTAGNYTPSLYVDKNGFLRGEFWQGGATPIKSGSTVTDGNWHHVVLSGAGNTQTMYLDGTKQGDLAGTISMYLNTSASNEYVGAGYIGGTWPDHAASGSATAPAVYFSGSIADVGFFTKALTASDVTNLHWVGRNSSSIIQKVTTPAGRVMAQVATSNVTGQVTSVTDENGGVWTMNAPTIGGSSDVYAASVLGAKPSNYWRLGERDADTTDAVNQVAGGTANYDSVTLGAEGPFTDSTAASFDGSASAMALWADVAPAGASSVSVWFNTTATGKVLLASQGGLLGETTDPGLPTLWVDGNGRLRGLSPSTSPTGPLQSGILGKCVDLAGSNTTDGTKIQLYDCNGSTAQNWTWNGDGTVNVLGKCLDINGAGTANNTKVLLWTCSGAANQLWVPDNGRLRNPASGRCLDDPGSATANATQLQIYDCNTSNAQKWTMALSSGAAVNDGKWHNATLTSSGTNQVLYIDGVKNNHTNGTVALTPGTLPFTFLGAGVTGLGWSGLPADVTSYFSGKLAEAAFFPSELSGDQVAAQWAAAKQTVPVAVTTVDTGVQTITMPIKNVTVTDPGGKTLAYAYDLINNRQVAETDALGNTTKYGYDTGGYSNLVYDPRGVRTQQIQDERGNTIQQITCQLQSANNCTSTYYGFYLNASSPVDPRNDLMITSRDGRSANKDDNTYLTSYSYDAKGNPVTSTDPLNNTTSTTYTDGTAAPAGLPARIVNPAGGVQTFTYNVNGDLATTVSPAGEVSSYTYDRLGRKLTETVTTPTFPNGRTTTFTYDAQGRVLTETDAAVTNRVTGAVHTPVTTNVYDADGNMTSQTISDSTGGDVARTEKVTFNEHGQKASQSDAVGKSTGFTYDAYGQVVAETDSDGGVTEFDVDAEGNVLSETMKGWTGDPNHPSDPRDLVTEANTYDPNGRLDSTTDAAGRKTYYDYTDDGLTSKVTVNLGDDWFVQQDNTYDADGNLITQVTNNGTTTTKFEYDRAGRQTTTATDPAGLNRITTNVLDANGRPTTTRQSDGSGAVLGATDYRYDPEGRITAETRYNGDPATTPIGRWKLNETTGATATDTAGNSPGTSTATTWSANAPAGHTGSAVFSGDAAGAKITTGGPVVDTRRPYTVSAWVYLTAKTWNRAAVSQDGPVKSAFQLGYDYSSDRWRMMVSNDSSDVSVTSSSTAPLNTWAQLTAAYDGNAVTFYVNGDRQGTPVTTTSTMAADGPFVIGAGRWSTYPTDFFTGQIADVQAYQAALTEAQIKASYGGSAPAAAATVSRTSYQVDPSGLVTRSTDPLGNDTDIAYDESERPAVTTAPAVTADTFAGRVTARPVTYTGYDTFGDPTETVDGNGNRTTSVYDRAGRAYEVHKPRYVSPEGTTIDPVTSVVYDTLGQATSSTDERGNVTRYTYDQLGRVAKTVTPNDGVTTVAYDEVGEPIKITGPTGAVNEMRYDFLGRKVESSQAVRQTGTAYVTKYDYNAAGLLAKTTTPAGVPESYTYNSAGDRLTVTDGAGQVTTSEYDALGQVTGMVGPDGAYQTTSYDMLGRAKASAAYASKTSTTVLTSSARGYDAAGNVLTSTDGRGTTTSFSYDATGMVLTESQPTAAGAAIGTSFGYDLNGNRTRFTDGRGYQFWTTYNSWNLPEATIEPSTSRYPSIADRSYTTSYDAAGQAVKVTAPGGVTQTYAYDSMGLLTSQAGAGAAAATTARTFGYDLAGRMTSFSAPGGNNTVSYDDRDLPLSITGPSGNSSFTYNGDGLMASRTDAAGTTAYTYDGADRLATLKNTTAGADLTYAYDSTSAISKITYGGTGNTRNFAYDGLHQVTADELKTAGGTTIAKIGYTWDANGNETSKTTTAFGGTTITNTYGYDLADRLTSWNNGTTATAYTYDASGNRTGNGSTTYTYDERNRLVSDTTGVSYTYSPRGTQTAVTSPSGTQTTTSDAFDQAITQSYAGGTKTYGYDALGRTIRTGLAYTGTGNDLAGDGTATYARDPDSDVVTAGGRLVWTDLHDDIVGQFTATGTALTGSTIYDPLGAIKSTSGMLGNLGYQSEYTEPSTGRVNMAARWYNTATGQFDSRDTVSNNPVPDSVNANRYQYGDANPLTVTDPSGHRGFWGKLGHAIASPVKAAVSYGGQAMSWAGSTISAGYHYTASKYYATKAWAYDTVAKGADKLGMKKLAKKARSGRNQATKKSRQEHRRYEKAHAEAKRKGTALKQRTVRAVQKKIKQVSDAKKRVTKFVKDHKKQIIAITATVLTVAAAVALGPVGGIVAGIAINVAKDALSGNIHSLSDLGSSLAIGAVTGVLGAVTGGAGGMIAGKIAGVAATKFGAGLAGRVIGGAVGGGFSGGAQDAASQLATTRTVNWSQTRNAAVTGALIGGVTGGLIKGRCHSFDPQTRVLMANGMAKPIGQVELGDKVVSTDPESGETKAKQVSVLHHHQDTALADVTVKDAKTGKSTTINVTANHPFWNASASRWSEAKDLKPGDKLRSPDGESTQTVTAIKLWTGLKWMDDLTVNDIHTYYVLAGHELVLVHNNAGGCVSDAEDAYDHGGTTRYNALDEEGRATGASTVIHPSTAATRRGTAASRDWAPPGWSGNGPKYNEARGHLLGNKLGGMGSGPFKRRNIVTLTQNPVNSPYMRDEIENAVYRQSIDNDEVIQYSTESVYGAGKTAPLGISVRANGNKGYCLELCILNPGGK